MESDKNIERLEDQFWNADTSRQEEQLLKEKAYDTDAFAQYQHMLDVKRSAEVLDDEFDDQILAQLPESKWNIVPHWLAQNWMKVAAVITITVMLGYGSHLYNTNKNIQTTEVVDTYEDPREAFEATKRALLLMSEKLNEGQAFTAQLSKFNEVQESIKKEKK